MTVNVRCPMLSVGTLLRRLAMQVAELHTALEVAKGREQANTEAAAKAPAHGLDYETTVFDRFEQIAYSAGDSLTRTGTTPGAILRALTGDAVIALAPNGSTPPWRQPRHRVQGSRQSKLNNILGRHTRPRPGQPTRRRRARPPTQPRPDARLTPTPPHPQSHRVPHRLRPTAGDEHRPTQRRIPPPPGARLGRRPRRPHRHRTHNGRSIPSRGTGTTNARDPPEARQGPALIDQCRALSRTRGAPWRRPRGVPSSNFRKQGFSRAKHWRPTLERTGLLRLLLRPRDQTPRTVILMVT